MSKFVIIFVTVAIFAAAAIHNANADELSDSLETLFKDLDGHFGTKSAKSYDKSDVSTATAAMNTIKVNYVDALKNYGMDRPRKTVKGIFQKYRNSNTQTQFKDLPLKNVLIEWGITS